MKKFLAVLTIAGALVACNDNANTAGSTKDSLDSAASEVKDRMDSTNSAAKNMIDSNTEAKKDMVDSLHKGDSTKM